MLHMCSKNLSLMRDFFAEFFDLVGEDFEEFAAPEAGGGAHFQAQLREEIFAIGDFFPHLGQEGGAANAITQHHAVDARAQTDDQLLRGVVHQALWGGEARNLDFQ